MIKLNANGTKRFFAYACERHTVYLKRRKLMPRPWTKDPILQQYRFTNVFRELDKTTVWFREHVRDRLRDKPEVMLATVMFRLLNRIEVGEAIFNQLEFDGGSAFDLYRHSGDIRDIKRAIKQFCGKRGPYTTGAYIISSPPGYPKLDGMMRVIDGFAKGRYQFTSGGSAITWRETAEMLLGSKKSFSLESTWEWFRQFDYFGSFHSYEIVTDLRHTALLDRAPDIMKWANVGPGARRGANRVMGYDKDARELKLDDVVEVMVALLHKSRDPKLWPTGRDWPKWEMRDVEHTLCEFDKYERVRNGEGTPRGVFK
jgi:hypothetical protein